MSLKNGNKSAMYIKNVCNKKYGRIYEKKLKLVLNIQNAHRRN